MSVIVLFATILAGTATLAINDIRHNEMAVPYNFGIYPTSPSTLRLIWDSPDVNEDDIIYYVHVIELEEDPVEEDFCSNIMPGLHTIEEDTPKPGVTISDGKSVPTPQTKRSSCQLVPPSSQADGPVGRKEKCYAVKKGTQLVLTGLSSYERYQAKIHACYDAMLGVCSDTVSVIGRTLPEDPLNRLEAPTFSGEEPSDTPGTIVKLSWQVPKDDSVRALAVVLRINDRKAVMLCRSHADIKRYNLTFEVLIVGPGQCYMTAKAASHVGWHEWHDVGKFLPRMARGKLEKKNNAIYKDNDVLDGREVPLPKADPAEMKRVVSFMTSQAHVKMAPILLGRSYDVRFQVKTLAEDGLIMYTANSDQSDLYSVSMVGGRFVVVVDAGGGKTVMISEKTYHDGTWHNLLFKQKGGRLTMQVDRMDEVRAKHYSKKTKISNKDSMFFGGIPSGYTFYPENAGTGIGFMGCIKDVFIKGKILDFSKTLGHSNMSMTGCLLTQQMTSESEYIIPTSTPTTIERMRTTSSPKNKPVTTPRDIDNRIDIKPSGSTRYPCFLSSRPIIMNTVIPTNEGGIKFGDHPHSRHEYNSLPVSFRKTSDFSVDFKTFSPTGLIFYAADMRLVDSMAVFLLNGKIHFMFNCGSGPARLTSSKAYNDGEWHTMRFWRNGNRGQLSIDSVDVVSGDSPGLTKSILVSPPYYVGGIPASGPTLTHHEHERVTSSFDGCLRNFKHRGKHLGAPDKRYHTTACSNVHMENGTFFPADGGYVKLYEKFKVGLSLTITIEVKPRSINGLLLFVRSKNKSDRLILQIKDGEVVFTVDNGAGPYTATFTPPDGHNLCDGRWHRIDAIKKNNVLLLDVDGNKARPAIGPQATMSAHTDTPLYIGGVPKEELHMGVTSANYFFGCMRNFRMNQTEISLSRSVSYEGKLQMHSCPVN